MHYRAGQGKAGQGDIYNYNPTQQIHYLNCMVNVDESTSIHRSIFSYTPHDDLSLPRACVLVSYYDSGHTEETDQSFSLSDTRPCYHYPTR